MRQRLDFWQQFAGLLRQHPRLSLFIFDLGIIGIFALRSQHFYAAVLGSPVHRLLHFCFSLGAWLAALTIFGFYDLRRWQNSPNFNLLLRQPLKALTGGFCLSLLVLLILLSPQEIVLSRKIVSSLLVTGLAVASRLGLNQLLRHKRCRKELLVVVESQAAALRVRKLLGSYCPDYRITALLTLKELATPPPCRVYRTGLDCALRRSPLGILSALNGKTGQLIELLRGSGVREQPISLAEVLESATGRLFHYEQNSYPNLIWAASAGERPGYELAKRTMDLVFSLFGLVLFAPVLLVLAVLIKLDSRGPVFYRQVRVGYQSKYFKIIKLRTMAVDAERETGAVWAKPADPRATRMGRWLRPLHLDEIPQLFNVLKGEMSLVGPRPERPELIPQLVQQFPAYAFRLGVLPGVTGWAQINRPSDRRQNDVARKLDYDLYYLKNRNALLDLRIILRTLDIVLFGLREEAGAEIVSMLSSSPLGIISDNFSRINTQERAWPEIQAKVR